MSAMKNVSVLVQEVELSKEDMKDLLAAVHEMGRLAAMEEFSTHVVARNPYREQMDSEEYFAWLDGYFVESNSIAASFDISPLSEVDWSQLVRHAQSGRYATLCA